MFQPPVVIEFGQRQGSSYSGAILLRAADQRLGLTFNLGCALEDERNRRRSNTSCASF
jgi:hypothetical protein